MRIYSYVNVVCCTYLKTAVVKSLTIYRDRLSGNSRDGRSAFAWYLQPLPDTRPSYTVSKPVGLGLY